ncbi:hypothetical protein GE21DRAFT_1130688 [Neurospora crassa]|nr:hypothetical protein GE21DRAFT_1130688 [Neurospora crassa]
MVMTLGISIAFYFRSTFRDGMAHNEARLLVNCCDILGFFQESTWYYYYQLSKSRWTGSRVWSLDNSLLFVHRSGGSARTGLVPGGISTFRQNGGGGCGRVKKKMGGCRVWKDEERVELMGCIAYSGKHRNTIMSGV